MFFFSYLRLSCLFERLQLILLNIKATFFRLFDAIRAIVYYPRFVWVYLDYLISYGLENPYQISLRFHKRLGFKNPYLFGVTPIMTIDRIASECGVLSTDHFIELGSGTGLGLFWLENQVGCQTTGIEWIPRLVEKSSQLATRHRLKTQIVLGDFFKEDLSKASFIYVYGTCMNNIDIQRLCSKFETLDRRCQLITISFPLSEYSSHFEVIKKFSVKYPWGSSTCFINKIKFNK